MGYVSRTFTQSPNRFLSTYRNFWDYSGGYITDFGNHRLDTMPQIMNVSAPHAISASGRGFVIKDDGETPDFLTVAYEYDNFIVTYEGCNLNTHGLDGRTPGISITTRAENGTSRTALHSTARKRRSSRNGSDGRCSPNRISRDSGAMGQSGGDYRTPKAFARREAHVGKQRGIDKGSRAELHRVRASAKTPNADIETGHRSNSIALLGNIAMKTGKKLRWDAKKEDFVGASDASGLLTRNLRKPWDLIKL